MSMLFHIRTSKEEARKDKERLEQADYDVSIVEEVKKRKPTGKYLVYAQKKTVDLSGMSSIFSSIPKIHKRPFRERRRVVFN